MILYSVVPAEIVFQGFPVQNDVTYFEAGYRGERIVVAQTRDGQCSIARLISTSPGLFLDPSFQPGNAVDIKELDKK